MKKRLLIPILGLLAMSVASGPAGAVSDRYISQGDNYPPYLADVSTTTGAAVSLTGTTVTAKIVDAATSLTVTAYGTIVVTDPPAGMFEYQWGNSDTARAGMYYIYFTVQDGLHVTTYPTKEKARVIIENISR